MFQLTVSVIMTRLEIRAVKYLKTISYSLPSPTIHFPFPLPLSSDSLHSSVFLIFFSPRNQSFLSEPVRLSVLSISWGHSTVQSFQISFFHDRSRVSAPGASTRYGLPTDGWAIHLVSSADRPSS